MKEFIEKLIGRLEEEHERCINRYGIVGGNLPATEVKQCIEIVKELAEEYECEDKTDYANIELYAFWQKHQWIPCSERLPEDGQQVLVYYNNCLYSCMSVAKFRKGKTKEELQAMERPCFGSADQWGNNLKPYAWFGDGPMEWFGQEIIAWQPLPDPYKEK